MKFFFFCALFLTGVVRAEIYDCFTFFNELELLRLRLEELNDVVDHFVLVESPLSFTGKKKPLYYRENAHLFDRFKEKIIHIVIDEFTCLTDDEEKNHWSRETQSRDAILLGLQGCQEDDVIFISDVDEIPRNSVIPQIEKYLEQFKKMPVHHKEKLSDTKLVCGLDMRLFMYSMNRENSSGWYGGSKAAPYWVVRKLTPWGVKLFHHQFSMQKFPYAGWHFNTMGGKDKSLYKWLHTGPIYFSGVEKILLELEKHSDLLEQSYKGQVAHHTAIVPIDDSFPKYFLENINYFREIGWLDE